MPFGTNPPPPQQRRLAEMTVRDVMELEAQLKEQAVPLDTPLHVVLPSKEEDDD